MCVATQRTAHTPPVGEGGNALAKKEALQLETKQSCLPAQVDSKGNQEPESIQHNIVCHAWPNSFHPPDPLVFAPWRDFVTFGSMPDQPLALIMAPGALIITASKGLKKKKKKAKDVVI